MTQGKPKVNFEVNGGVWYDSDNADLAFVFDPDRNEHVFNGAQTWVNVWSDLKGYNVPIDHIEMANYQDDFDVDIPEEQYDEDGVNGFSLRRIGYDEVLKNGTYTLKFKVVYRNKIGTKAADIVTMKLVLK